MIRTATSRILAALAFGASAAFVSIPVSLGAQQDEDRIIVTGSRIPRQDIDSVSPLAVVDNEEFKLQGVTRTEDIINSLPQVLASQGSNYSNGSTATATLDLRGLGSIRTLVLINGRRLPPGNALPNATSAEAPDLNQIPSALIKQVEIVTGGASAVYGADAAAGVANFIIDTEFEGLRIDANYSFFQHDNNGDNPSARETRKLSAGNPSQFFLPKDNVVDGESLDLTAIFGTDVDSGRGHIVGYVGYREDKSVLQGDRDFSSCALRFDGTNYSCGGSGTSYPGQFRLLGEAYTIDLDTGAFRDFDNDRDLYNFNPYNYYMRPSERIIGGFFGQYEVTDRIEAYSEFMYMNYSTVAQIAPSGMFGLNPTLNCDNALLTPEQFAQTCGRDVSSLSGIAGQGVTTNPDGSINSIPMVILRRNVEGGFRQDRFQLNSYRAVVGLRGDYNEYVSYDAYANFSRVDVSEVYANEVHTINAQRAVDSVRDPNGNVVCRTALSGVDTSCVPYDIFSPTGPSAAALGYVVSQGFASGYSEQFQLSANIFGELEYALPTAEDGVGYSLGVEYRSQELIANYDDNFRNGVLAGQGGPSLPVGNRYTVFDIFGEVRVPLLQGRKYVENLDLELGYRYSDYSIDQETNTFKAGLEYVAIPGLKMRASYQRSVRAPTIRDLYVPQSIALFDSSFGQNGDDPCGANRQFTLEQCQRTGLPAAFYGNPLLDNPAGQYNLIQGGNEALEPEKADTYAFGIVHNGGIIEGLNVQVDYFSITIEDAISNVDPNTTLQLCADTGSPIYCDNIRRGQGNNTIWIGSDQSLPSVGYVSATNVNIGSLETQGIDVNADYSFAAGDYGDVRVSMMGTYLLKYDLEELPGQPIIDCVGFYTVNDNCERPRPEWRHRMRVTFRPNSQYDYQLSAQWRYVGEVELPSGEQPFDAENYLDLTASYTYEDKYTVFFGVNNVFDSTPPLSSNVGSGSGNGNTFPQVYDALGRYFHVGATLDF